MPGTEKARQRDATQLPRLARTARIEREHRILMLTPARRLRVGIGRRRTAQRRERAAADRPIGATEDLPRPGPYPR